MDEGLEAQTLEYIRTGLQISDVLPSRIHKHYVLDDFLILQREGKLSVDDFHLLIGRYTFQKDKRVEVNFDDNLNVSRVNKNNAVAYIGELNDLPKLETLVAPIVYQIDEDLAFIYHNTNCAIVENLLFHFQKNKDKLVLCGVVETIFSPIFRIDSLIN